MNIQFDLSLNTLVISIVVAVTGWLLKGVAWLIIEGMKSLVQHLVDTQAQLLTFKSQLEQILGAMASFEKMKADLNGLFGRVRDLEKSKDEDH